MSNQDEINQECNICGIEAPGSPLIVSILDPNCKTHRYIKDRWAMNKFISGYRVESVEIVV